MFNPQILDDIDTLLAQGQNQQALTAYQQIASHPPQDALVLNRLGLIAHDLKLYKEALVHYSQAITLNQNEAMIFNNAGNTLFACQIYDQAKIFYQKALTLKPDYENALYNLGLTTNALGDENEAYQIYQQVLKNNPNSILAHLGLADIADSRADAIALEKHCHEILKQNPNHLEATILKATALRHQKNYNQAEALIDQVLQTHPDHSFALYEKGHLLHALKNYPQAFEVFKQANSLTDEKTNHKELFIEDAEKLLTYYQNLKLETPSPSIDRKWPIFIVGSSRSGTTLLEQMLAAHSSVYGAGELKFIGILIQKANGFLGKPLSYIELLKELWENNNEKLITFLRYEYQKLLNSLPAYQKGLWMIDKMPSNAWRLALIARIAPEATIIHMIRDGREVALSNWMQNFKSYQWYAHDLNDAILEWQWTIKLARNAAQALAINYTEVFYEKLVEDPQTELERVFEFLNLEMEDTCLEFFKNQNRVTTASSYQVKQSLYKSSLKKAIHYPEAYEHMTQKAETILKELGYV